MKLFHLLVCATLLLVPFGTATANPPGGLPPGLEKNVEQGKPLPPGWRKKLQVGHVLDYDIYRHGHVLSRHGDYVIIRIEDQRLRLIAETLEIVDILSHMD